MGPYHGPWLCDVPMYGELLAAMLTDVCQSTISLATGLPTIKRALVDMLSRL